MIKFRILTFFLLVILAGIALACFILRKTPKGKIVKKLIVCMYMPLAIWSVLYFFICLVYAGAGLSWIWLWPLIAVFSILRIILLRAEIKGKPIIPIPGWLRITYRVLYMAVIVLFVYVEGHIIDAMTATPPKDLEYVIVLGAGLIGDKPSNTLRVRIEKAAEYMSENADTILIASGGKGTDERISEAECIRRQLTEVYGIEKERIILEDRSADTAQNLAYSLAIIGDPDAFTGIITNSFHEYRAMLIADHTGYTNAHSVPATTLMPVGIHYLVREFFGVVQCMGRYGFS